MYDPIVAYVRQHITVTKNEQAASVLLLLAALCTAMFLFCCHMFFMVSCRPAIYRRGAYDILSVYPADVWCLRTVLPCIHCDSDTALPYSMAQAYGTHTTKSVLGDSFSDYDSRLYDIDLYSSARYYHGYLSVCAACLYPPAI